MITCLALFQSNFKNKHAKKVCVVFALALFALHTGFAVRTVIQLGPNGTKVSQEFPPHNVPGRTISFSIAVQSVDVGANTATLSWEIAGDSCIGDLQAPTQWDCANVDLYFLPNFVLVGDSGTNPASTNFPTFMWNITALRAGWQLRPFQTSLALTTGPESTILYPFDHYETAVVLFATASGSPVNVQINRATFSGASYSVGFTDMSANATTSQRYAMYQISTSRSAAVKVYAIEMMITTWLMTAALAFAIGASVLFGSPIPIEVLLVPVGALFAFSQLRTTLPGLPEVSAVDYVCFQPCLFVLSFSAVLAIVGLIWDQKHRESLFHKLFHIRRPTRLAAAEAARYGHQLAVQPEWGHGINPTNRSSPDVLL